MIGFAKPASGQSGHERAELAIRYVLDGDGERTHAFNRIT
jgi:hypothetical protein